MTKTKLNIVEETKELLSDPRNRIKLDDFVTKHLKVYLDATTLEHFPVHGSNAQKENFVDRMQKYEQSVKDLQQIATLIARWGEGEQLTILENVFRHTAEAEKGSSGLNLWLHFGWYPIQILMYSAGIAALSARRYSSLKVILTTIVQYSSTETRYVPIAVPVTDNLANIHDAFKWIPDEEKKHTPRSEHLYEILGPTIQELLFLGKDYERLFDDFEVYFALVYADAVGRDWGPIGRFGWKHGRGVAYSPFSRIVEEAKNAKEEWRPIRAGFFNGSSERFLEVADALGKRLNTLSWW